MTEKNEAEDGNSISLKSPWHMKWDRQQFLPFFPVAEIGSIMHLLYFSYPQEIWAQFVEWGKKVLSPYSPQWSVYFSVSLLQIAGKHPVFVFTKDDCCDRLQQDRPSLVLHVEDPPQRHALEIQILEFVSDKVDHMQRCVHKLNESILQFGAKNPFISGSLLCFTFYNVSCIHEKLIDMRIFMIRECCKSLVRCGCWCHHHDQHHQY